eukprot:scaffold1321_cov402-Prasinococcus_capsulatus_cf.AAC.12
MCACGTVGRWAAFLWRASRSAARAPRPTAAACRERVGALSSAALALPGVGRGTTVDHVEVAYDGGDGFELVGGTVNLRYISSIMAGDDAIDVDLGYQGGIQFAFALAPGDLSVEIDSEAKGNLNAQPRSHPKVVSGLISAVSAGLLSFSIFNAHLTGSLNKHAAVIRAARGAGGTIGQSVVSNMYGDVLLIRESCGREEGSQSWPPPLQYPDYMFVSANMLVDKNKGKGITPAHALSLLERG